MHDIITLSDVMYIVSIVCYMLMMSFCYQQLKQVYGDVLANLKGTVMTDALKLI